MSKKCRSCSEVKELDEFYVHPKMKDGHLNRCKTCVKTRVTRYRDANAEDIRKYDNERAKLPERIDAQKEYNAIYRIENRHKKIAQQCVKRAVDSGSLERLPCIVCGNPKSEGHHEDYSRPLDVVWLCSLHHKQLHHKRISIAA